MQTTHDTTVESLERQIQTLDRAVSRLAHQVAATEMNGWDARIEQLRLEATLARMEIQDEVSERIDRVKTAYEAARRELEGIPDLVEDAVGDLPGRLRPALDQVEKVYREVREILR